MIERLLNDPQRGLNSVLLHSLFDKPEYMLETISKWIPYQNTKYEGEGDDEEGPYHEYSLNFGQDNKESDIVAIIKVYYKDYEKNTLLNHQVIGISGYVEVLS